MNFIYCFLLLYARDPRGILAFHSVLLLFPYVPISASRMNMKSNCSYYATVFFCAYLVECRPCVPLLWHVRCL